MPLPNTYAERDSKLGLTIVELLVVLSIIGILATLSIPLVARMGLVPGRAVENGGRDLFTMLRAARVYATTYNVDTALAYGGAFETDTVLNTQVPIIDSWVVVRKATQQEENLIRANNTSLTNNRIFVPLRTREGQFTRLSNQTCILPDIFEVTLNGFGQFQSATGLEGIVIYDVEQADTTEFTARSDYGFPENDGSGNTFPAHIFTPSGAADVAAGTQQRIGLRVGLLPSADPGDRFVRPIEEATTIPKNIRFLGGGPTNTYDFYVVPATNPPEFIANDIEVSLYWAMGRVKISS